MKNLKYILLLTILISVTGFAQEVKEIKWMTLDEALELQKQSPKKIFMDVYTSWCGPCKMLDKRTFHNPDVVDYISQNYYAVKFNAEGNSTVNYKGKTYTNPNYKEELANRRNSPHRFTSYMRITGYPTLVFFDESGEFITPLVGYKTPQQLELFLKLFGTDKYKEFKTQEEYYKYYNAFVPQFKG